MSHDPILSFYLSLVLSTRSMSVLDERRMLDGAGGERPSTVRQRLAQRSEGRRSSIQMDPSTRWIGTGNQIE